MGGIYLKKIYKLRIALSGLTGAVVLGGGCVVFRSKIDEDTKIPFYKDVVTTYKVSKIVFEEDENNFIYLPSMESEYLSKGEISDLDYFNGSEVIDEGKEFIYKVDYNTSSLRRQTEEEDYEDFYYTFLATILGATTFGLAERTHIECEKESYQKVKR